jgi:hypothetical protein
LNLKTPCIHVDDSRNVGETHNLPVWQVSDIGNTGEWEHVMFTQTVKFDSTDHNHFVVFSVEQRVVEESNRIGRLST